MKRCLGVYKCPVDSCGYLERPKLPTSKSIDALPPPPEVPCKTHRQQLIHTPCQAKIDIERIGNVERAQHHGYHYHQPPPSNKPTGEAMAEFEKMVKMGSEAEPKKLLIGTKTRKPVTEIHSAFANLSRTAYHRKKILDGFKRSWTITSLVAFDRDYKMMGPISLLENETHIIIQAEFMKEMLQNIDICMQTDSIESFVHDEHYANINITFTSAFNFVINRAVPVV
ncbi:hypothetical protein BX616_008586, partial [Lobosporangium transversale]